MNQLYKDQKRRWSGYTIIGIVVVFLLLVVSENIWERLGVYHMRPYYADLVAVLAAGEAHVQGIDIYERNPLDPYGRPHVYGPWWLVTGRFGLTGDDAWWLGTLLWIGFVIVTVLQFSPRNLRTSLLTGLIILSPPVLLGMERGNNDLIIYLMLAGSAWLVASRWRAGLAMATGMVVVAASLKLYPLVALSGLLADGDRWRRVVRWGGVGCLIFAGMVWWYWHDFMRMFAIAPRPVTIFAYGIGMLTISIEVFRGYERWLWFGLSGGLVSGGLLVWRSRRSYWHLLSLDGMAAARALAGGTSWLFCYLANTNFPYRVVLLMLVAPSFLAAAETGSAVVKPSHIRTLGMVFLATLWMAAPKFWLADQFVTGGNGAHQAGQILMLFYGVEQGWMLAISVAVAITVSGWFWRRGHVEIRS